MTDHTRISRRDFFKLNAIVGSALAVSVALPAVASANTAPNAQTLPAVQPHTLSIRFGTPTDVAATWAGEAWSVDAEGTIRKFDRARHVWLSDDADSEANFPANSQFVLTRWGRPSGPSQMLLVLGPAQS